MMDRYTTDLQNSHGPGRSDSADGWLVELMRKRLKENQPMTGIIEAAQIALREGRKEHYQRFLENTIEYALNLDDEITRLRELNAAYKGQVESGSKVIERLRAELAAERERCAAVATQFGNDWNVEQNDNFDRFANRERRDAAFEIAAAIRATET